MTSNRTTPPEGQDTPQSERSRTPGEHLSELLESTLPPTPLRDLLAAEGAGIYVFSDDSTLIETVQQAGSEHYPVFAVDAWQDVVQAVEQHRCGVAMLDIDTVGETLERRIAQLRGVVPDLVILVASPRKEAEALMGLLSDRKIHRLLIKPPALGITRLLLESAVSRYLQTRERLAAAPMHAGGPDHPSRRKAAASRGWPAWVMATALVSLALGGIIVAGMSRLREQPVPVVDSVQPSAERAQPPVAVPSNGSGAGPSAATVNDAGDAGNAASPTGEAQTAPPAADTRPGAEAEQGLSATGAADSISAPAVAAGESVAGQVGALLQQAEQAVAAGRLIEPPDNSAIGFYQQALGIVPGHPAASDGLDAVVETLFTRAEEALLAEDPEQAATWLAALAPVRGDSPRFALLETQLGRLQASLAAAAAGPETPAAAASEPPGELESLLAIGTARIERGQLLEPAGDSARAYLERARLLAPQSPQVQAFQGELAAAVAASAEALLDAGQLEQAEARIIEARGLGAGEASVAALDIALATAREEIARTRQSTLLANANARLDRNELLEPADDSALYYVELLRQENPAHPGLAEPVERLAAALAGEAAQAIEAADWAAAERWLAGLERAGGEPQTLIELERRLTFARNQAEFLATPAPAGELTLLEAEPPVYPAAAVRSNIEGWVDLEFVVDRDGVPQNLEVTASEPPDRFDEAALEAVSAYRFEPFELDGQVYERRVELRVRFALQ